MIDLTPVDIRKKKGDFRRAVRGYEPSAVDDFLELAAERMEEVVRENLSMGDRIARMEEMIQRYRERERALNEALVTAQEVREEVRRQAEKSAELVRREAENDAETVRQKAETETEQLRRRAETETEQLRRDAARDAEQTRRGASAEAEAMLSDARRRMELEEDALRRLRARREQTIASWRRLLEREMAELDVIAGSFEAAPATAEGRGTGAAETDGWGEHLTDEPPADATDLAGDDQEERDLSLGLEEDEDVPEEDPDWLTSIREEP